MAINKPSSGDHLKRVFDILIYMQMMVWMTINLSLVLLLLLLLCRRGNVEKGGYFVSS